MTKVWSLFMGCPRGQRQELLAGAGVVTDQAVQRRGHGLRAELLHAPQRHAQVLGLEQDTDAPGLQLALQPAGDLGGQALLDLQVAGEQLDDAAELAQADDPLPGQVADVRDPVKGQQMVHAQGVEGDRTGDDQLVVAVLVGKRRRPERLGRQQLGVGVGDPARRLA
jgi:hypothetical protein